MLFAFRGRAPRNFLALLIVTHCILFVEPGQPGRAAGVMQQDLALLLAAAARAAGPPCPGNDHRQPKTSEVCLQTMKTCVRPRSDYL